MKYDIYISHSRKDYAIVSQIVNILNTQGYSIFIDTNTIYSGQDFADAIIQGIENSSLFLFISSENSNQSQWIKREVYQAFEANKTILPIQIDKSDFSRSLLFLKSFIPLDLIGITEISEIEKRLLPAVSKLLGGKNSFKQLSTEEKESNLAAAKERRDGPENYLPNNIDVDIFISYRRLDGRDYARNIMQGLKIIGYPRVFFDYNSLRDGVFNTKIIDAIYSCNDFLLVISPLALKNCSREGDWVSKEIRLALKYQKKIIPIVIEDTFKDWPEDFPSDLSSIKDIQFHKLKVDEYFESSIDMLADRMITEAITTPASLTELQRKTYIEPSIHDTFMYKVRVDRACRLMIDEEEIQLLEPSKLTKIPLAKGEYLRKVIDINNDQIYNETVIVLDQDKVDLISFDKT